MQDRCGLRVVRRSNLVLFEIGGARTIPPIVIYGQGEAILVVDCKAWIFQRVIDSGRAERGSERPYHDRRAINRPDNKAGDERIRSGADDPASAYVCQT